MSRLVLGGLVLLAGFSVLFFSSGSRFALGLMLKPMTDDLGWSRSTLSFAVTLFMIASALALPLAGRLVDRYSLWWVLAMGATLVAVAMRLMEWVTAPWQAFLVYGLVFALGYAGTSNPVVGVMISRWFVRRRGIANSVAVSGNATGQLVLITILAAFLTDIGWRASYHLLWLVNLIIAVPLMLTAPLMAWPLMFWTRLMPRVEAEAAGERAPVQREVFAGQPPVLRSGQFWLLVFLYAVCGFQDFLVATHVVAFASDQGVGAVLAGNMLALMGLTGLIGVLCAGLMSDAFGAARPLGLCFIMRIGIFALIIVSQSTPVILVFALLYGFTFLMTAPLTVIFSGAIFGPRRLGTVTGTISMVHQMAGGLGALAGAVIFDHRGSYQMAFILMLGLSVVSTLLSPLLQDTSQPRRTEAG